MKIKDSMKKEYYLFAGILIIVSIFTGIMIFLNFRGEDETTDSTELNFPTATEEGYIMATTFKEANISEYKTKEDCLIIYNDGVYEITSILTEIPELGEGNCGKKYEKAMSAKSESLITPYLVAYTYESQS